MGTPKRPQCTRIAHSYYVESSFGVAFNNSAITKLLTVETPPLLELTQAREDDAAVIKGYEFPYDTGLDLVATQDVQVPFTVQGSLSTLGWLFSLALGTYSVVTSSPNYVHTFKIQDLCVSDNPPSSNVILGFLGDTASFKKLKGAVLGDLKITIDKPGNVMASGTIHGDGSLTDASTFTFPSIASVSDGIQGRQADFLTCDYGGSLVSKKSLFMGAEFTINNNPDKADGHALFAANNTAYLTDLRLGDRVISLTVKVQGHQGDEFWTDYLAGTVKDVQITVTISATAYLSIRAKKCKIASITQSFAGLRDQNEITYKLFYEDADVSPVVVVVENTVAQYKLPITAGM